MIGNTNVLPINYMTFTDSSKSPNQGEDNINHITAMRENMLLMVDSGLPSMARKGVLWLL